MKSNEENWEAKLNQKEKKKTPLNLTTMDLDDNQITNKERRFEITTVTINEKDIKVSGKQII